MLGTSAHAVRPLILDLNDVPFAFGGQSPQLRSNLLGESTQAFSSFSIYLLMLAVPVAGWRGGEVAGVGLGEAGLLVAPRIAGGWRTLSRATVGIAGARPCVLRIPWSDPASPGRPA